MKKEYDSNVREELYQHIGYRKVRYMKLSYRDSVVGGFLEVEGSFNQVKPLIDIDYNSGLCEDQQVFGTIWFEAGSWSERVYHDGEEYWKHNECPKIPAAHLSTTHHISRTNNAEVMLNEAQEDKLKTVLHDRVYTKLIDHLTNIWNTKNDEERRSLVRVMYEEIKGFNGSFDLIHPDAKLECCCIFMVDPEENEHCSIIFIFRWKLTGEYVFVGKATVVTDGFSVTMSKYREPETAVVLTTRLV